METPIAKLRTDSGYTQRQIADYLGCTIPAVRNWENGRAGEELFLRLARLCKILGCTPDRLTSSELGELPVPKNKPIVN